MRRIVEFLIRFRFPVLALFIPLSVFFHIKSKRKVVDNSFDIWLEEDDPEVKRYERFLEYFEGDEFIAAGYIGSDIFTPATLEMVRRLGERLSEIDKVLNVFSLWTVENFEGDAEEIRISPLIEEGFDPAELERIKEKALKNPLVNGFLLSRSGDALLTVAFVPPQRMEGQKRLVERVEAILDTPPFRGRFLLLGPPVVGVTMNRESIGDERTFYPLIFSILFVILSILFKNLFLVFMTFLMINISLSFATGIFVLLGQKFNMIISIAPPLLLAMTTTYTIHIVEHFRMWMRAGLARREAIHESIVPLFTPLLFSALTTGAGFSSFFTGEIKAVRIAGLFIGGGIFGIFVITFILMPVFLSFFPEKGGAKRGTAPPPPLPSSLSSFVLSRRWWILGLSLFIALLSIAGSLRLRPETSTILFFKKNHPLRRTYEAMGERSLGFYSVEIFIEAKGGERLDTKEIMERILEVEEFAEGNPYTVKVFGPQTYLKEMKRVLEHGGGPIPDTDEKVRQFLFLYEISGGESLFDVMTPDRTRARVSIIMRHSTSEEAEEFISRLGRRVRETFDGSAEADVTGIVPLFVEFDVLLMESQIRSFGVAITAIFLLISLLLRSLKIALVCMIPNLIPIGMSLAIMGFGNIPVDVATMMIAGVALGIAVDNTLYFTVWFKRGVEGGKGYEASLKDSHRSLQKPIIFASITLFSGFLVLATGTFKPTITFGVMSSLTMIFAALADLLLLPALFLIFRPFGRG